MKNNVAWISSLKAFGIIAVILGHIDNPLNEFIFSWHMPLFFMISGFFIKPNFSLKDLIIKDWKRLIIPYFIFAFLGVFIESIKRWGLHREPLVYVHEFKAIFLWMDMEHLINSYAFVLWFLPALFFAKIIYYIVKKSVENLFTQFFIFVLCFLISFHIQLPFALSNALNSVLWLFIGSNIFRVVAKGLLLQSNRLYLICTIFIPVLIIIGIYLLFGIPSLNMSTLAYGNKVLNVLWAASLFIIFIFFFKALSVRVKNRGVAERWGGGTMMLFILHPYTNNISYLLVEKLNFGSWPLKLLVSLILLQLLFMIKQRFGNRWIFKYV